MDNTHKLKQKVYYADTDAYGVVWHGNYLRWLEMGRVGFCDELLNLSLVDMQKNGIVLPVVNVNINYKSSAKLADEIIIETSILEINKLTITFFQTIREIKTDTVCVTATIKVVAVDNKGKLYRTLPATLTDSIKRVTNDEIK